MMDPIAELKEHWICAKENKDSLSGLCILATVDENNFPHLRMIELKEIKEDRISILISNTSPKWKQLNFSKNYELLVYWHSIPFQARVNGNFIKMKKEERESYWKVQPYNFRILDLYYSRFKNQSHNITSESNFRNDLISLKEAFPDNDEFKIPDSVEGIYLIPNRIEFWQGSHDFKIPDRELFHLTRDGWKKELIIP